ncbi:hypothetical protein [Aureliella helgolandensis]|uniref:Uncharacterized protein n=1 Tax=Aureliella helgolandensis TaxID=2527968 RepID=A0A518GEY8_9BACT|nr:hypothetical protein [Aureliella helgolandensis]QDV27164.1 hypothetical protein Q31a_55510 [Aureliella helgolandensis]
MTDQQIPANCDANLKLAEVAEDESEGVTAEESLDSVELSLAQVEDAAEDEAVAVEEEGESESQKIAERKAAELAEDSNAKGLAFLEDLEARHTRVLDELDELNTRIESVLEGYLQSHQPKPSAEQAAQPAATGESSAALASAEM